MDLVIDFVIGNYVWFIIIGILILMAVVGYIADKTDFGRNVVEKEHKEKVRPEKVIKEKPKKEKSKKEKVVEELPIKEQNNIELANIENVEQSVSDEVKQDFSTEVNTFDNNDNFVTEEGQVDQSLFEPLPSMDQFFDEKPMEQNKEDITSEPINIDLSTQDENKNSEIESDDDIWKF